MLQMSSAFETLHDGQFPFSTRLVKPDYLVILLNDVAPQFFLKDLPHLNHQRLLANSSNLALEVALASEKVAI